MNENGKPAMTETDCNDAKPPANNKPSVIKPVAAAQNKRNQIGASVSDDRPFELKLARTSAPESAEVTKKSKPMTSAANDQTEAYG